MEDVLARSMSSFYRGLVMLPMLRTRFRLPPASCPAFQPRDLKELTTSEAAQILTVQT